jgi:hypothetical protein
MKTSSQDPNGVPFGSLGSSLEKYGQKYPQDSALGIYISAVHRLIN